MSKLLSIELQSGGFQDEGSPPNSNRDGNGSASNGSEDPPKPAPSNKLNDLPNSVSIHWLVRVHVVLFRVS